MVGLVLVYVDDFALDDLFAWALLFGLGLLLELVFGDVDEV